MNLRDYSSQLQQLLSEVTSFDVNAGSVIDFMELRNRYSELSLQFMKEFSRMSQSMEQSSTPLIVSGKVPPDAVRSLKLTIENTKREIDFLTHGENDCDNRFRCFKIGHRCPHEIDTQKYLFFVGMPFNNRYIDSYQRGIKAMLEQHGIDTANKVFKADEQYSNGDILCKICKAIQEAQNIIINISEQNPNVMFELGLAYGLNKNVFLIKDKESAVISDLSGLEYTSYSNAEELASKLEIRFHELVIF